MRTLHLRLEGATGRKPESAWDRAEADGLPWSVSDNAALDQAAAILRGGGTVAMPTETVYGLAANALDPTAMEKIFAAKQRPHWDPLIVHIADLSMLQQVAAQVPEAAQRLMDAWWPGPLTLLLPRAARVPDLVTAGRPLVGLRMPSHPVARELIRRAGVPLAAPSANRFGHISPTTAEHVLEDLDGRIDAVLDAGATACGVESTVVDPTQQPCMLYRPGAVSAAQLEATLAPLGIPVVAWQVEALQSQPRESLPSPGVGLRHYAPRARLLLVPAQAVAGALAALPQAARPAGLLLPLHLPAAQPEKPDAEEICAWGDWLQPETMAATLYAGLRALDAAGCRTIVAPIPPAEGIGAAILDRLRKAAVPEAESGQ